MLHGQIRAQDLLQQTISFFKNIIDVLVQGKFSFTDQKTDRHAGDALAHRIRRVPDAAAVWGEIAFADDLSVPQDQQVMHVRMAGGGELTKHLRQLFRGDSLTLRRHTRKICLRRCKIPERFLLRRKVRLSHMSCRPTHKSPDHFHCGKLFFRCHVRCLLSHAVGFPCFSSFPHYIQIP